jgi:hypothetical protein
MTERVNPLHPLLHTAQSVEVKLPDHCLWCDKPAKRRNMCWMHLKRAQRSGELAPYQPPPMPICKTCRIRPAYRRKGGQCRRCYHLSWRIRNREKLRAQDREKYRRRKLAEAGNESQLATVVT